ncbi:hypothetical protein VCHA53O466_40332 [Vibrio chagasii]|nr:hypothetical protein VCHA53O466_40332 [Vibrio chagasii]
MYSIVLILISVGFVLLVQSVVKTSEDEKFLDVFKSVSTDFVSDIKKFVKILKVKKAEADRKKAAASSASDDEECEISPEPDETK